MNIIKKEILEFSEKESDALQLVTEMCLGIERECESPVIRQIASEAFEKLSELWGYEE